MEFSNHVVAFVAIFMAAITAVHAARHLPPASLTADWQTRRLMAPTPSQLAAESREQVFIYDSLSIEKVNAAMDEDFDRIQNMMFIRIHHPPETEAGEVEVEDDDC